MSAPPDPMLPLLALDTATELISLGVQVGPRSHTRQAPGGAAASAQLVPQIHSLLAEAGLRLQDLRSIAFGRGPGAFTGLRTACSVAQGLGLGLGVPLLPLDSLMLVAEDARLQAGGSSLQDVAVAMDARMEEAYAARYRWLPQQGRWLELDAPALYTLPALAQHWAALPPHGLAGSAATAFGPRLVLPASWLQVPLETDRAGALLRLALQAAASTPGIDAAEALPLYLRDKVALTTHEREAARAAAALP